MSRIGKLPVAIPDKVQVELDGHHIKLNVGKILARQGYVESAQWIDEKPQGKLQITLRYDDKNRPMIRNLKRISKPSRRVYVQVDDIPSVLNGMGIAILSTSKGLLTDSEARAANVGGELLCSVY